MANIELGTYNYNVSQTYSGTVSLDGNNFAVSGLKNEAIFRIVQGSSASAKANITVKNLIINASINRSGDAAAVIRKVNKYSNVTMTNVTVYGTIKGTGGADAAGALVSWSEFATSTFNFTNCINYATVSGDISGGLCGLVLSSSITMTKCANFGSVSGKSSAGGLVGNLTGTTTFTKCFNTGAISSGGVAGGLLGAIKSDSTYKNCYNTATISSTGNGMCGGFIGQGNEKKVSLTSCYNSGSLSTGYSYVKVSKGGTSGIFGNITTSNSQTLNSLSSNRWGLKPMSTSAGSNGLKTTPLDGGGDDGGTNPYTPKEIAIKYSTVSQMDGMSEGAFSANSVITASKSVAKKTASGGDGNILTLRFDLVVDGVAYVQEEAGGAYFGELYIDANKNITTDNHCYGDILDQWLPYPSSSGDYYLDTKYSMVPEGCKGYVETRLGEIMLDGYSVSQYISAMPNYSYEYRFGGRLPSGSDFYNTDSATSVYYMGACYALSGNTLTFYSKIALCCQVVTGPGEGAFAQRCIKLTPSATCTIPTVSSTPSYISTTISASTLGTEYKVVSGMNGGYPILKDFYWAYS